MATHSGRGYLEGKESSPPEPSSNRAIKNERKLVVLKLLFPPITSRQSTEPRDISHLGLAASALTSPAKEKRTRG